MALLLVVTIASSAVPVAVVPVPSTLECEEWEWLAGRDDWSVSSRGCTFHCYALGVATFFSNLMERDVRVCIEVNNVDEVGLSL